MGSSAVLQLLFCIYLTLSAFAGIALWLCPTGSSSTNLSNLIQTLASTHSTTPFPPHVTLISGIPSSSPLPSLLLQLTSSIVSWRASRHFSPLVLPLGPLGSRAAEKNRWQYLFSTVPSGPSLEPLLALRKAVRTSFFLEREAAGDEDEYFPHLSLIYGEDTEERSARGIIKGLEKEGTAKKVSEGEDERWSVAGVEEVSVTEVLVVRCDESPEEWKVLGSVPL
ncbi:hypothetical protein JCM8547_003968 [Rhodosporidiobolus lusitaniae]